MHNVATTTRMLSLNVRVGVAVIDPEPVLMILRLDHCGASVCCRGRVTRSGKPLERIIDVAISKSARFVRVNLEDGGPLHLRQVICSDSICCSTIQTSVR
jgi:hypothetical protein